MWSAERCAGEIQAGFCLLREGSKTLERGTGGRVGILGARSGETSRKPSNAITEQRGSNRGLAPLDYSGLWDPYL